MIFKRICAKIQFVLWFLVAIGHTQTKTHTLNYMKGTRQSIVHIKKTKILHLLENYFGIWADSAMIELYAHETVFFNISFFPAV